MGENFYDPWAWGQNGKGNQSWFPAIELPMELSGLDFRSSTGGVGLPSVYLLPWEK